MSGLGAESYRLFRLAGRPVLAVPARPWRLRLAALTRFEPRTWTRAAYRRAIQLAIFAGLDRLLGAHVATPTEDAHTFHLSRWLARVRDDMGDDQATAMMVWPRFRHGTRLYIHVFRGDFEPLAFAKVALTAAGNERLRRESNALRVLEGRRLNQCRVPRVISFSEADGCSYLLLEPIPSLRPHPRGAFPAACVAEYAGSPRRVTMAECAGLSWWADYAGRRGEIASTFTEEFDGLLSSGLDVCRAHGDLAPSNLVVDGNRFWVYDWEHSRPDAPMLTDEVGYYLAGRRSQTLADPARSLQRFRARFLANAVLRNRINVMAALAFCHGAGFRDATELMRHWPQPRGRER